MENLGYHLNLVAILSTVVYAIIGLLVFAVAMFIMQRVSPFSIRKEIEVDQNIALAIIMGSIFIALAIIIQSAMR